MRKKKPTRYTGDKEIKAIGGNTYKTYCELLAEVERMNANYFEIYKAIDMDQDKALYIEAAIRGTNSLIAPYQQHRLSEWLALLDSGDPEKVEKFRALGYSRERLERVVKMAATRELTDCLKELREAEASGKGYPIWHCPLTERYFAEALALDPERGLIIDCATFLRIFEALTEARNTASAQRHRAAVEALNKFFERVPASWAEVQRYFAIEGGRFIINPASERKRDYMRLS